MIDILGWFIFYVAVALAVWGIPFLCLAATQGRVHSVAAWYDLWLGAYWDRADRQLYLMVPFVGVRVDCRDWTR